MNLFYIECEDEESCKFFVGFLYRNRTFFFCKVHKFGVNVSGRKLGIKHFCSDCGREMERYNLAWDDNVCPICERSLLAICYVNDEIFNDFVKEKRN